MCSFIFFGLWLCSLIGLSEALRFISVPNATNGALLTVSWVPNARDVATTYFFNVNLTNTRTRVSNTVIWSVSSSGTTNHTYIVNNPFRIHDMLLEGTYKFYAVNITNNNVLAESDSFQIPTPPLSYSYAPSPSRSQRPITNATTPASSQSNDDRADMGVIVGSVLAGVSGAILLGLLVAAAFAHFRWRRRGRRLTKTLRNQGNLAVLPLGGLAHITNQANQGTELKSVVVQSSDGFGDSKSKAHSAWEEGSDEPPPRYEIAFSQNITRGSLQK